MTTCINVGANCVGCHKYCIDARQCTGECHACINKDCENNPQAIELCGYADELYA